MNDPDEVSARAGWESIEHKLGYYPCCPQKCNELKQVFGNASIIANSRAIFNLKGNDFRLIISLNLEQKAGYVIWFGTHAEYDRINAATIAYDISINNFKKP